MSDFSEPELNNFWEECDYAREAYELPPLTDRVIQSVQEQLGFRLPPAYIALMRVQNGGIPRKSAFPTTTPTSWAEDHVAITGIMGIGDTKEYSLCGDLGSQFMMSEWGYPQIGVYFADCPSAGHDMICLDYRSCGPSGEPRVVHVDQSNDFEITHLADDFSSFLKGLVDEATFDDVDECDDITFIWRVENISAQIQNLEEVPSIGRHLFLTQSILAGETGWVQMRLRVPSNWDVDQIALSDGALVLQTHNAGAYRLIRDNIETLGGALLAVQEPNADSVLQSVWTEHAAFNGGPFTKRNVK